MVDFISISNPLITLPLVVTMSNASPVIFPAEIPADCNSAALTNIWCLTPLKKFP